MMIDIKFSCTDQYNATLLLFPMVFKEYTERMNGPGTLNFVCQDKKVKNNKNNE